MRVSRNPPVDGSRLPVVMPSQVAKWQCPLELIPQALEKPRTIPHAPSRIQHEIAGLLPDPGPTDADGRRTAREIGGA